MEFVMDEDEAEGLVEPDARPANRRQLWGWVRAMLGTVTPWEGVCEGHGTPLDYLEHVFFERPGDAVVWANRGGGKTYYGAAATVLDMVFKPGVAVRILGGSLGQSHRMYEHLRRMMERPGLRGLVRRADRRGMELTNGSAVELLAQAETSVRGVRVQKIRCDEVDLFNDGVWDAAQFVTQSKRCGDVWVRGSVEAMSTAHKVGGLMGRLVEQSSKFEVQGSKLGEPRRLADSSSGLGGWRLFKWCVMEVMARCEEKEFPSCEACRLAAACGGRARGFAAGFVPAGDVRAMRGRVSPELFDSEMLCKGASLEGRVYRGFSRAKHVRGFEVGGGEGWLGTSPRGPGLSCSGRGVEDCWEVAVATSATATPEIGVTWVGGMDFGYESEAVFLWARVRRIGWGEWRVEVVDEHVAQHQTIEQHMEEVRRRPWPAVEWIGADPAGRQHTMLSAESCIERLRGLGFGVRDAPRRIAHGVEAVRRLLDDANDGSGPRLVVHERCVNLLRSLEGYRVDGKNGDDAKPLKNGLDHAADALRYLAVNLDGSGGEMGEY